MSLELMSLILVGGLVVLLVIGAEVYVAVGFMAAVGLLFFVEQPLTQLPITAFGVVNSYVLTAVPLFIFMGTVFSSTGIIRSLFQAADKWVGNLPGGIVSSVIGVNALFGAMCGSTFAATATFGRIAYPDMERLGYNPKLALGALAVGGILSAAIPPSLTLVVYGAFSNVSVPRLFAGTLIPGIILTLLLMLTVVVLVKLNPSLAPKPPRSTWKERLKAVRDLLPWIGVVAAVLGVIFGGVMTPTEAASLGAILSVTLALGYKRMSYRHLKESLWSAVKISSMCALIMFTARALGIVFQYIGLTELFSEFMLGLPFGRYGILATLVLIYLICGMFIDDWSMLVLTLPFVLPIIKGLGFSPVWFGVFYVMVGEAGLITPPFGLHLFILQGAIGKHDIVTIALGALPFLIPMLVTAAIITAFPDLVLWLPSILY